MLLLLNYHLPLDKKGPPEIEVYQNLHSPLNLSDHSLLNIIASRLAGGFFQSAVYRILFL
jgi:hypothetical protein